MVELQNFAQDDAFRFEDLPVDMRMQVVEELLGPPVAATGNLRTVSTQPWPFRLQNRPNTTTDIPRVNQEISTIAKTVLYAFNKWVVFDIDCSHLLLPQAYLFVPFIVVDPEDAASLPLGIMQVRVQLYRAQLTMGLQALQLWPPSKSHRQLFLVHVENFESFLREVRVMELVYATRIMQGTPLLADATNTLSNTTAKVGQHGLKIRVDVHGNFPSHHMKSLLNLFRMFQGPLNEVCIQGFEDSTHTLAIEQSITKGTNTVETYLTEQMSHFLRFQRIAIVQLCERKSGVALVACPQATRLFKSIAAQKDSAETLLQGDFDEDKFIFLSVYALDSHYKTAAIMNYWDDCEGPDEAELRLAQVPDPILAPNANDFNAPEEIVAWNLLVSGLYCIFCYIPAKKHLGAWTRLTAHGKSIIVRTENMREPTPTALFDKAFEMLDEMRAVGVKYTDLASVVDKWRGWFAENIKPVVWRVHASIIPKVFRDHGVLTYMTKYADLVESKKAGVWVLVADGWVPDGYDEESELDPINDWYCV
ncbi:hypothetical protein BDU57DRAFT_535680 [Ampelomyces quisqualis]|uniref:Uncharacterized protein n=1 Tax=Ampelomyces quisqualis TaxID=50730 RepID=A0A6A5QUX5_AMPQU|nr:hypothetical protein BDU57DRAFT_535680 [Ampelomyces quisqualis]